MESQAFAILDASIILSGGQSINIKESILEFFTYEHIQKPYVDARVVMVDDVGIKDTLSIQGTERLVVLFGRPEDYEYPAFFKTFYVQEITDAKKINERSEVVSISLVEEHVYIDSVKQISRSFSDRLSNIIEALCLRELGKKVSKINFKGDAQGIRKVIVPYLSPLEAISWIKTRATTETGGPIYLYSTIFSNDLYLSDFDSLMAEEVVNAKLPLRYAEATKSTDDKSEPLKKYFNILSYKDNSNDNMMQLYENGAIGSFYANLDAGTGFLSGDHISIRNIIDEMYINDIMSNETSQTIFDPLMQIQGKLSDEYNSVNIFQITSSKTYNQYQSFHDEATILDDNDNLKESKLKVKNKIINMILKKNTMDIGLEGHMFMEAGITVGKKIRCLFLNSDVEGSDKDSFDQIDKRKSGDYFIMGINHIFRKEAHLTTLRVSKLSELPKNFEV